MAETTAPVVKQEDFPSLIRQYDAPRKPARERDAIAAGRYRVLTNQPLPEFDSMSAKAYGARDEQSPETPLYALVYDTLTPPRQKNITALKGVRHPHMVMLVEDGIADIGLFSESRYVVILERPVGQRLLQRLSTGNHPVSETILIEYVLRPLVDALLTLNKLGISHNRINLGNVYVGANTIMLGECVSEPSGFSQHHLFEPIERLLTSPWAKADTAISADCYALAVLALHVALGTLPFAQLSRETLIDEILSKGSYHALALQWDFSEGIQDFFRGLLNDSRRDRWTPENIKSWLDGRRFNLILPSLPRESSRGFEFAGRQYFNSKSIANALAQHWPEARALLGDTHLARWLDTSAHKPDAADAVARLSVGESRSERLGNEALSRIITILDPAGPVRLKHISVTPEGIGLMLAHAFLTREQEDLQLLAQIIESELTGFWLEQQKGMPEQSALVWKMQKVRQYMRMNGLGFGIERCLYDLHPGLACQSPLVKRYHVTDLEDLLLALDAIAPQKAAQDDCMDRHIAAFIASRLDIGKDIRIHELETMPELALHPRLIALKLFVRAQHKAGNPPVKGLCVWVAGRLFPLLATIHKRALKVKLQAELRDVAQRGQMQDIANILLNPDIFVADYSAFQQMAASYAARGAQITQLRNKTSLARHARVAGRGLAQTVAYSVCLLTVYLTFKTYFHF